MRRSKEKTFYPAVTLTVLLIAFSGAVAESLRRFVPPPGSQNVDPTDPPFFQQGTQQEIPWQKLSVESLAQAKREDKPILFVVGDASSRAGKVYEDSVFKDPEFAEIYRRNFVCIRVDATLQPYLASLFDPIYRARDGWDPSFQIWYLTPDAKVFGNRLLFDSDPTQNIRRAAESLRFQLNAFRQIQSPNYTGAAPGASQSTQANTLLDSGSYQTLDTDQHRQWLADNLDKNSGGWPVRTLYRLNPQAYDFLIRVGDVDLLSASLEPVICSGIVDWIRGGFFYQARGKGWTGVDYEKYAVLNAEMALICAKAYRITGKTIYREAAELTLKMFQRERAALPYYDAYEKSDAVGMNRSQASSFSVRFLAENFSIEEQLNLDRYLDLNANRNPEMHPRMVSIANFESNKDRILAMLESLRQRPKTLDVKRSGLYVNDVNSTVVARLIETARLMDNRTYIREAATLFKNLATFRSGYNDVLRQAGEASAEPAYLGDYLAYADAALQQFLLTGSSDDFSDGLKVLRRAIELFATRRQGVLINNSPQRSDVLPGGQSIPELVDRLSMSTSAKAIDLANDYGLILSTFEGEAEQKAGQELIEFARGGVGNFALIANETQRRCSGVFAAGYSTREGRVVICRGPNALANSEAIFERAPAALVVPRPTEPGPIISVYKNGERTDTESVEQAAMTVR